MQDPRERLVSLQNPDGGWGYYPGKSSCLEPTAWALLALDSGPSYERGWRLLQSWQLPSGAWQAGSLAREPSWATSLVLLLHGLRGEDGPAYQRGLAWLLEQEGRQEHILLRLRRLFTGKQIVEQDSSLTGWPWRSGNHAWVEPTSYAVLALRACNGKADAAARRRIDLAERMLLDRRCRDGGWNYGNKRVLDEDLGAFPETTAAALLALHAATREADLAPSFRYLEQVWSGGPAPMATGLTRTVFRVYDIPFRERPEPVRLPVENTALALDGLSRENGAWRRLRALKSRT